MRRLKFFFLFGFLATALGYGFYTYPVPLRASVELGRTLFLLMLLCGVTVGLGRSLLRRFGVMTTTVRQELVFSFGLGCAGLSLILQVLGLLGGFKPQIAYLLLAALIFVSWEHVEHFWSLLRRRLRVRGGPEAGAPPAETAALLVLGAALLPALALSLAPVTFYDSLVYHLALPQEWVKNENSLPMAHNFYTWLPGAGEHLWTFCLLLDFSSTRLATLFNFSCGLVLGLALWDAANQLLSQDPSGGQGKRRLWAPVLLLTQPVAALAFAVLIPDGLAALHAFLAFYAFAASLAERNTRLQAGWLMLACALSGAAASDKLVAACAGAVLAGLILFRLKDDKVLRRRGWILAGVFLGLLPLLPWLGRNLVMKGNPIFPFGLKLFSWQVWASAAPAYFAQMGTFGLSGLPWTKQWMLPLALVYEAERFGGGGLLSPLFLGLVPVMFLAPLSRLARWTAAYLAGCFVLWAFTGQVLRFTLYALPAACLLAVELLAMLKDMARSRTWALGMEGMVWLALLAGAGQTFLIVVKDFDPFPAALGLEAPEDYLQRRLRYTGATAWAERNFSPQSGLLILGDERTAYWPGRITSATLYENSPFVSWLAESASAEDLNRRARKAGCGHVFINWEESRRVAAGPRPHFDYFTLPKEASSGDKAGKERIFRQWVEDYLRPEARSGGGVLYEVMHQAPPEVPSPPAEAPGEGRD